MLINQKLKGGVFWLFYCSGSSCFEQKVFRFLRLRPLSVNSPLLTRRICRSLVQTNLNILHFLDKFLSRSLLLHTVQRKSSESRLMCLFVTPPCRPRQQWCIHAKYQLHILQPDTFRLRHEQIGKKQS
jgi:hypothetical protein